MKEKHIVLTAEARNGVTKKHAVSDKRLIEMLQGSDQATMPTSEEVRWMAYQILCEIRIPGTKMGKYTFSRRG